MPDSKPPKRRFNASEKRVREQEDLALFGRRAGRKARKGYDPNDRAYDPDFQRKLRKNWKSLILGRFASEDDER